ncbi:hypothetical protein LRAMOSA00036 [Lichtheimia ramosa]|uniref:Anoctamin dimerisation domain-containing protein n=1 Tax=Lichtheimia ramosa TaxID=688394 RepID=A0A077W6G9_9FUNG|nr:hypothetical protein LRAMOSA00036 [Lichtheimia ramosa]
MDEQHKDTGPASFSHLFPVPPPTPTTEKKPSLQDQPIEHTNTHSTNAGVDYVIVFRFPTDKRDATIETRVRDSMIALTAKLTRANLCYQVKPGRTHGTLLVLVGCPSSTLEQELERERIRDFLLGIRVKGLDDQDASLGDTTGLTDAERLRVVYEILTGPESDGGANISPNLDPYVESIMALHDDRFDKEWIHNWSRKWLIDKDDLTKIRNHFGEKVAYYFAFLQYYFLWLIAPASVGGLMVLFGGKSLSITYSLGMLIWSVTFIEMWKRKEHELAVEWNVRNCSKHERKRVEFKGDRTVKDQVTGEEVPYCPPWKIFTRRAMSIPGVAIGAAALSVIVACVFVLQLFLHEYYNGPFKQILHYAPTIGYVLLIPTMTNIYSAWMRILNNYEMHKTETSWEYHYTQKIFVANFLVAYLSLFFIAWIYIPFGDHVLPYLTELNVSHSHQKVDFQRLRGQLVYFVVTGQVIGFATEMILPYAMKLVMPKVEKVLHKDDQDANTTTDISDDATSSKFMQKVYKEVDLPDYNIYTDYVEMVIQFGYVSMFSSVWPLTSFCCLINNWVELRGDALKICKYTRRPIPLRAEGVGPWIGNMETLTWLSSITMSSFAYLFHPTTNIHSSYTPIFTILAILLAEHLYVALRLVIRSCVQALPSWSDIVVRKEEFNLKKIWLNKLMATGKTKRSTIDASPSSSGRTRDLRVESPDPRTRTLWSIDSTPEATALQLIQNAFKTE